MLCICITSGMYMSQVVAVYGLTLGSGMYVYVTSGMYVYVTSRCGVWAYVS